MHRGPPRSSPTSTFPHRTPKTPQVPFTGDTTYRRPACCRRIYFAFSISAPITTFPAEIKPVNQCLPCLALPLLPWKYGLQPSTALRPRKQRSSSDQRSSPQTPVWLAAAKQLLALVQTSHRAHGSQSQAEAFAGIYASEILKISIQTKKSPCTPRACSHLKPVPDPRSLRFAPQFTPVRCCSVQGHPKRRDRGRSCCLPHSSAPGRSPPGTGATSAPDACTHCAHWGHHAELCLVAVPNLGQCQAPK